MRDTRTLKKLKQTATVSQTIGQPATHTRVKAAKQDTKSFVSRNIVSLLVLGRCFRQRSPSCVINLSRNKNVRWSFDVGWGKLLRKVERRSSLSNQFWLCSSFIIKLTIFRDFNFLGEDKLIFTMDITSLYTVISNGEGRLALKHFFCPTSWSRKVKNAKHRPKTSNETMLRETKDFVSCFAAFTLVWVAGRPIVCDTVVVCFSFFRVLVSRISLL